MEQILINKEIAYRYNKNPNYFVTKSGKIYSIYKKGGNGKTDINCPHLLSYGVDKDGYYRVVLSLNGKRRYVKVHTVIAEQFIGKIKPSKVINHKDGNKKNNDISNLEIISIKENTVHAHKNGLTSNEIPVTVIYKNKTYNFKSITECQNKFPDLSKDYLQKIRRNIVLFSMIKFKKANSDKRITPINAYYNGLLFKTFNSMQDADEYFGKRRGSTSSAIKYSEYRNKVNNYHIIFSSVSTIKS